MGEHTTTSGTLSEETAGYTSFVGSLGSRQFTYLGTRYSVDLLHTQRVTAGAIVISDNLTLAIDPSFPTTFPADLALELDGQKFLLNEANRTITRFFWGNHGLTWAESDSVAVKLTGPFPPNAYGYRTIWTALMTAEPNPSDATRYIGYYIDSYGEITNNIIVDGRDETVTIGTVDQPRFPWTGFEITNTVEDTIASNISFDFDSESYPSNEEVAGWTLVVDGKKLPFAKATNVHASLPHRWIFDYAPGWTAGQQVVVSIRTEDVQNRFGQVALKAGRSTSTITDGDNNIVYLKTHSTYARGSSKFGQADSWELKRLRVTTDKTGDTDPVWIAATFRAPNESAAWTGYWVGEFDDFHTLFLRWVYHDGGIGKGEATYTLPLKTAATEGGIRRSRSGREVTFTWVRTYKEFQRRHLDLANHSDIYADMLAPPKPATARAGGQGFSLSRYYDPAPTVTSVGFTSNPGSDRVYGPGDTIQVTVTFDQDVTVGYVNSKRDAAKLDLEMGGQTRTAHYARTDGNKVIFEYTVRPGDETPSFLFLRPNSLRLYRDTPSEDGSIQNSSGGDAVLDHYGLADNGHLVDTVGPEFANAQVSNDGAQVTVTFNEGIRSPAILRAFGVQTSLLQSLALDVRVDGEIAVRSDAAVSGDTVTLTVSEPITQGQTVTVSYDNLFIETGESIFEDLRGNSLLPFAEQPATNGSTVADVDRPGGGLALSRNDLLIKEGQSGTYTVVLTSQPAADVTVAIGDHPAGRATVSPTSLTFTADNWNTPQTVTITSAEDSDYVDRWVLLQHVATGDNYGASAAAWLILRDNYNLTTATANTPAAGSPTIGGTPEVGQTLTLDISSIADAEGLTNASYTYLYQWLRNGAEIRDATDTSYTLVSADEGKVIKVKVSFLDDSNNQETRTSAATAVVAPRSNSPPTGTPTINGTPQVRRTLTADTSGITDADGLTNVSYSYQWIRNDGGTDADIAGETASTHTLVSADEGKTIKVRVSFTDDAGNEETLTSAATAAVASRPNTPATGLPTISGTVQVDETLTTDASAISDEDGLSNVSYQYQWLRDDADIAGQTNSTYRLVSADQDKTIKVRVTFRDDADNAESLTSMATTAVAAQPTSLLTASFANVPADHDGSAFTFDLNFSENVEAGYARIRDHAFTVTGATIDSASRITQGSNQGWNVEVNPTGNGAVTITLPETTDCDASGAICTDDSRKLSQSTSATVAGPPAISVSDATVQEAEGAVLVFTATLSHASSRTVTVDYATSDGTAVAGSDYTAASGTLTFNAGDTSQAVKVTVLTDSEDESQETLTLTLSNPSQATLDDATGTGTIENGESSSGIQEDPPAETPVVLLTASFANVPADHDGSNFTFDLTFSENVKAGYARIRDHAFTVSGGAIASASRITQGSNQGWTVEVDPTGNGAVSITLPETTDCDASGAICTDDSRKLSQSTSATVAGPPAIAVSDATVQEAEGAVLVFTATLSHASSRTVTVDYATSDGTAVAGSDYTAASGTLTFNAGDTSQTVQVTVLTDSEDESQETLTLSLSNPSQATLDDATGTGTIENGESSSSTVVNSPPNGLPTISGTAQVDETLTADVSSIADADRLTNVSYSYQWIRNDGTNDSDMGGQTGSTYTLVSADEGKAIKVRVSFTDDAGNEETLTSAATAAVAVRPNTPATGLPTISGTAQVDETLTADTSGISDSDGLTNVSYSYQWIRNDGTNDADIGGQTGSTYTLTDEDVGKTIKVRVSFTDDAGNEETLTSAATAAVRPNTPATGLPTISGTAQVGKTLTANISGMADEDGLDNAEFSYQWLANDADIQNATDSTYTLTDDDVGKTIKVRVSFTDDRSNDETLTSAATDTVVAKPDSPDTDAPPRDPGATVDVTVGNTVTGEIEEAIEVDWFKVSLLASETYQIDMRGAWGGEWARIDGEIVWVAPGTLHDPKLLGVFSAANVLVPGTDEEVSGDDRGDYEEGKNSRITSFSPPADGYYYIAAAAEAAWTGTYELTVTVVADE